MTTISATTILRSRNAVDPDGRVLSTLLLRYPRFIHAELMTHRAFSRNAASSRAIPVSKLIQDTLDNPVDPLWWGKNEPGMQAREELTGAELEEAKFAWGTARNNAVELARDLYAIGTHKQIVNRILEPFSHITVLVSATEWDNFLELRDHPDAEPHIQLLAQEVRKCLERTDDIQVLQPDGWHTPFVEDLLDDPYEVLTTEDFLKLSVARCASTSYKTVDGFDMTLDKGIALHDKLVGSTPIHASPAEHVAQADNWLPSEGIGYNAGWQNDYQHGNFVGFRQYRHML